MSSTMRSVVRWHAVAVAFSDGFVGGITGGALYRLLIAYLYPTGWSCSWMQVLALALILGTLEAWRVAGGRDRSANTGGHLMGLLVAALLLWWAVGAVASATEPAAQPKRPTPRQRATRAGNDHIRSFHRFRETEVLRFGPQASANRWIHRVATDVQNGNNPVSARERRS